MFADRINTKLECPRSPKYQNPRAVKPERGYYITKRPINPIRKTETPMITTTIPTP